MKLTAQPYSRRQLALAGAGAVGAAMFGGTSARAAAPVVEITPPPVSDPSSYDAYVPTACKTGPFFLYTCEFDASWAIMKTFGIDAPFEEQVAAIKIDSRLEPYHEETPNGFVIHGGDISRGYSGDFTKNFLARTTSDGMRGVFKHFGLRTTHCNDRKRIEQHLKLGRLIFVKMPVDFNDWVPATWLTPEGKTFPVVLGNDHAMIVIGFNSEVVVIRDVLGPTDTNWQRPYELEVPWDRFLACWESQGFDGLSVSLPDDE
jgi:hypothetical protein